MPRLVVTLAAFATVLAAYWLLLFLAQRALLFPAPPVAGAPTRPADAEVIWLSTSAGPVEAWYLPPLDGSRRPAPLLLFAHGNGELIDYWPEEFQEPRRRGRAVLLLEYPGYGRSAGRPSEGSITEAILAAYDWARARPELDSARVVGYGRSLGTGAVCALIGRRPLAGLILEAPFTSVRSFAGHYGAPGFLVRDPFDNLTRVAGYRGPLLILHGAQDRIIPPAHSEALVRVAPQAERHLLPCGHNDCPRAWGAIDAFLGDHGL
jgi:fermentation-respiration switch protein FrsA (DUF1100 family)